MIANLAEVITIGDEILYGQITDTNSQWISEALDQIGVKTIRKTSIGDTREEILSLLAEATQRAQIILITGGLGPTKDDLTKKTLAEFTDDHLVSNQHALDFITDFFHKRGRKMTLINEEQALIPSKATYLHNGVGTAPGMWFDYGSNVIVSMPGVPSEMKWLMKNAVLPRLVEKYTNLVFVHKIIRTIGIGESFLAEKIEAWEDALPPHLKLAYLPGKAQVKLRITGTGTDKEIIKNDINLQVEKLVPIISPYIFSLDNEDLEKAIGTALLSQKATLATAESCTGGYIAHLLTKVPGSSAYYKGSIIAYDNMAKAQLLGVNKTTIDTKGAVSEETVIQMAQGAKKQLGTDYAIATSGVAGPGGGTEEKPVGTIWLACAGPNGTKTQKLMMLKERLANIQYGAAAGLNLLRQTLQQDAKLKS